MSKMLDQFCDGLKGLKILKLVRAFPEEFAALFMYTGLTNDDVIDALCVETEQLHPDEQTVLSLLMRYIRGCSEHGKIQYPIHKQTHTQTFTILFTHCEINHWLKYCRLIIIPLQS